MSRTVVVSLLAVLAAGSPATASTLPLEGRIGFMALPMSGPALGAEVEASFRGHPLTLGLRSVATFPSPPMPAFHALLVRTTPVHPVEDPTFGLLGVAAVSSVTATPGGTRADYHLAIGVTYQQAWGNAWLRLSPNVMLPFDVMTTVMIAPAWLELGYKLGSFDLSLRSTATPLGLAFRF